MFPGTAFIPEGAKPLPVGCKKAAEKTGVKKENICTIGDQLFRDIPGVKPIEIDWDKFSKQYGKWKSKNITGRDFMRKMDLSANTFYRRVREYEI